MLNYSPEPYTFDYDLIPEGIYTLELVSGEEITSQAGNKLVRLKFRLNGPSQAGRTIYTNLNLYHPDDKVKAIAKKMLDGIGYALDVKFIDTLQTVSHRPMKGRIIIKENKKATNEIYRFTNSINRFYKIEENPVFVPRKKAEPINFKPASSNSSNGNWTTSVEEPQDDEVPF